MENLLRGIPGVAVYIDDILITGAMEAEHLKSLEEVLKRLERAGRSRNVVLWYLRCHIWDMLLTPLGYAHSQTS